MERLSGLAMTVRRFIPGEDHTEQLNHVTQAMRDLREEERRGLFDYPGGDDEYSEALEVVVDERRRLAITALGRGTPLAGNAGLVTSSLAMCDLIAASGVAFRAVACPSFMHNLLNQVRAIKEQGRFFMMTDPDLKAPAVATRDIAATAAQLLLDDSWQGVGQVACLGPEDLSPNDMARIISEVLGTEIGYQQITGAAFKERMAGFGMTDAMAQGMVDMFDAKNQGLDNAEARTAESTTPTTFRQWCAEVFKPAVTA
ncbi:NmrA family NAD(P)-binding protein [Kitasatospora sp. NPDC001683]